MCVRGVVGAAAAGGVVAVMLDDGDDDGDGVLAKASTFGSCGLGESDLG